MKTEVIGAQNHDAMRRAVAVLDAGGLVAFPTDTVYGLAAYPWNEEAVRRLYQVKRRPKELPIPVLLSDAGEIDRVATFAGPCRDLPEHFWPGGLTLVLPKKPSVSDAVSDRLTVAVRVPDLDLARDLIRRAGGVLAVTSANLSGASSPVTAQQVEDQLGGRIPLILDGGPCQEGIPSTILDCSVLPPLLLRRGAVSEEDLRVIVGALRLP
jgi:L-threonylcarbamoyladenylate synthase